MGWVIGDRLGYDYNIDVCKDKWIHILCLLQIKIMFPNVQFNELAQRCMKVSRPQEDFFIR